MRRPGPSLVAAWVSLLLVALALAVLLPLLLSPYDLGVLAVVALYAVASLAQNLLSGYAEIPSLGNVTFFATSAYTAASLISFAGWPAAVALAAGVVAAGLLGFVVGLPALRVSGMHLAIVTVALVYVAQELMGQWDQARGENGVSVGGPGWLLDEHGLYLASLLLAGVAYLAVWNLLRTRSGRAIRAVSGDLPAALAAGIDPVRYRLLAFVLSGLLTGAAGALYLYNARTVTPGAFTLDLSLAFLTMMILGGARSLGGSVLGALIIGLLPQAVRVLPQHIGGLDVQQSIYGLYALLLLLTLRFFPQGLWNALTAWTLRRGE